MIDLFIRCCKIEYVDLMRIYLLIFTYKKIFRRKKNSHFLFFIECVSKLFKNSFDIDLTLFFIYYFLIFWYVLLLIVDWIKMFISYCELNYYFQFYHSSCDFFQLCYNVNKISIIHRFFFRSLFQFYCVVNTKQLHISWFVFDDHKNMSMN